MPRVDDVTARAYLAAWEVWTKQIGHVHRVFLEDEPIAPAQLKGLLNRETRAKEAYDAARQRLLGMKGELAGLDPDSNPFI